MLKYLRSYRSLSLFNAITQSQSLRLYFLKYIWSDTWKFLKMKIVMYHLERLGAVMTITVILPLSLSHNGNGVTKSSGLAPTLICS